MADPVNTDIAELLAVVPRSMIQSYIDQTFPPPLRALYTPGNAIHWANGPALFRFVAESMQGGSAPQSKTLNDGELLQDGAMIADRSTVSVASSSPPPRNASVRSPSVDGGMACPRVPKSRNKGGALTLQGARIIHLTAIPECWEVPHAPTAYVLDLTADSTIYEKLGKPMSMDAIIKSHDQDSWGGGTAGSAQADKLITVDLLGGVKCQQSIRYCNGIYICSEFDQSLLDEYTRFAPDKERTVEIFSSYRDLGTGEGRTGLSLCATFYNLVMRFACPNEKCDAVPAMFPLEKLSHDGKLHFIGCTGATADDHAHRYIPIPRCIDEVILQNLLDKKGTLPEGCQESTDPCTFMVHPRTGRKGQCHLLHFRDGRILYPTIVHRECGIKMIVYYPRDRAIRRAVVYIEPGQPHNHPTFPSLKLSYAAREKVAAAVRAFGPMSATAHSIQSAASTRELTGHGSLGELHVALDQRRTVRDIVARERKALTPHGTDILGVMHRMIGDRDRLAEQDIYIREVSHDGVPMVVCMLQRLARLVHAARTIVFDTTYKTVFGDFNLWSVVIQCPRYKRRLIIARIFCPVETKEAFKKLWSSWFHFVDTATGRRLEIPVFDGGRGHLINFATDGDAAQAGALGETLSERYNSQIHGIVQENPDVFLKAVLRLCWVHADAGLDKLAPHCDAETMAYLRAFYFLGSDEEVAAFDSFCRQHAVKQVRDWYTQKTRYSWYLPALVKHLSGIPAELWDTTRGETNIAESSHAATNAEVGTGLSLLQAVDAMHKLDLRIASELDREDASAIQKNPHNTVAHAMRRNLGRKINATERVREEQTRKKRVGEIDGQIEGLLQEKENLTCEEKAPPKKRARRAA